MSDFTAPTIAEPGPSVEPQSAAPATIVRAALIALTQNGEVRTAFTFRYAPERMVRERERGGKGISETFTIPFSLDASDAIAAGDAAAIAHGLHPELAQLDHMFRESWLLLSWGASRTIPMAPTSMTVTETAFDAGLNPIRADITLQAERITLTTDANLGKFVNAGAGIAASLARLYDGGAVPDIQL